MSWVPFGQAAARDWDAFVAGQAAGRFVHRTGFKAAVEAVYGLKPFYWAWLEDGPAPAVPGRGVGDGRRIRGVFPGFFHRSVLYGRKIVSQPFSEYGGPLLADDLGAEGRRRALAGLAGLFGRTLPGTGFGLVEMRSPLGPAAEAPDAFRKIAYSLRAERAIVDPESLWKELAAKDRNVIRKARSHGLEFDPDPGPEATARDFYPLYLRTMKRLGSPPHPLAYFLILRRSLPDAMRLFIVRYRGRAVGAVVGWAQGRTLQVTDMCSDERFFAVKPNDFGIFEVLSWAYGAGLGTFDFGPVRYRGQEVFKKKWRMELGEFACLYWPRDAKTIRSPYAVPSGPAKWGPGLWRSFVPGPAARLAGRLLRREVGL